MTDAPQPAPSGEHEPLLPKPREIIARSSSWFYPFKGIYYIITKPFLWPILKARFLPCLILSTIIFVLLFLFTYLPQVAFLAIWQGKLAWFNGAILVLGEGAAIVSLLFEAFFVDEALVDIVDSILVEEGCIDLVATSRAINAEGRTSLEKLGAPTKSAQYSPFSFRLAMDYIFFLPLNFVPLIGAPLFVIVIGKRAGPLQHYRYLILCGLDKQAREDWVKERVWRYTMFGAVGLALQLVPILSMFFLMSTAAGGTIWAVHIEEDKRDGSVP